LNEHSGSHSPTVFKYQGLKFHVKSAWWLIDCGTVSIYLAGVAWGGLLLIKDSSELARLTCGACSLASFSHSPFTYCPIGTGELCISRKQAKPNFTM
jgi:hypothetical protein